MTENAVDRRPKGRIGSVLLVLLLVCLAFGTGYYFSGSRTPGGGEPHSHQASEKAAKKAPAASKWTCSMHPQIKLPKFGKCPICFMDLIPLETGSGGGTDNPRWYTMSEAAKTLAQVQTSEVKRKKAFVKRRMVGMVFENETTIAALTSRVDGRLDKIFVDFTGVPVKKGDPMVTIWSPTLITSQVELFETLKSSEYDESVVKGAEEKLLQFGLTQEQIADIREKKKPNLYVTLRAPISGVVMKKNALLGHFVKEGTEMYIISDLSTVWVKLDAYESDLPWIRYGQKVTFTTPSVPGRTFEGRILFIDPVLQMDTRSVKVRVEAKNPNLLLKPHMFVTAEIEAEVDSKGNVINSDWTGKAVCPVHPGVTGTEGESCPTSHQKLMPISAYGYTNEENPVLPLVIPSTAVLFTGKRSIVYVEVPDRDQPTYELREVVTGPRAGDQYVVYEGLKEGERVVTHGNFKIDSAMQILAKPSMMNPEAVAKTRPPEEPEEEEIEKIDAPKEFLEALTPAVKAYLNLKEALVEEKVKDAAKSAKNLAGALRKIKPDPLAKGPKDTWAELSGTMLKALDSMVDAKKTDVQRKLFDPVSESFARVLLSFRHSMDSSMFLFHCPMAFDNQGAYWIEGSKDLRNPYFGNKMLKCGELVETIPTEKGDAGADKGEKASASEKKKEDTTASAPSDSAPGSATKGSGSKSKEPTADSESTPAKGGK